jgi:hypothetical protein
VARRVIAVLFVLAGLAGACGSNGGRDPDAGDATDDASEVFRNPFTVDIEGNGSVRAGEVAIESGAGHINLGASPVPSIAYEMTDWSTWGYVLFHVLTPQADTLNVEYLYCEDDALTWVWHESYAQAMDYEAASGSCSHAARDTAVPDPGLIGLTARPSATQLVEGWTLDGIELGYASAGPGTITLGGEDHDLYPFEVVDCTVDCTADPADGWWELHSILESPEGRLCFGVLYMMVADTTTVQLGYPVCLDPLERLEDVFIDADWTVEPGGGGGSAPDGPRPPGMDHVLRPLPPSLRLP